MTVTVVIPTTLRLFTEHKSEVELEGNTVREILTLLSEEYPETKKLCSTKTVSSGLS